jgi:hypothetical protein
VPKFEKKICGQKVKNAFLH